MSLGLAVLGCGRIGQVHMRSITQIPDLASLVACVDARADLARQSAHKFEALRWYQTVEEALGDPDVGAVVVALPHPFHREVTLQAARAGKHVLVEKPMALSPSEGEEMVRACGDAGVVLMVGQSRRFFRALQETKARIEELGRPFSMNYLWGVYFDDNVAPPWWKSKDWTGGLIIPMAGSHTVDYTLWLFEPRRPVSVYARVHTHRPYFEGGDEAVIVLGFDDGSTAVNHLSFNLRPEKHECVIVCPKGYMVFRHEHLPHQPVGVDATSLWVSGQLVMEGEQHPDNMVLEMREFVLSILEGRQPLASGAEVLRSLAVLEAAQRSAKEGRVVTLPA